ncbi:hypothetical protein LJR034_008776 [Caballeronia sp. LjRoot34]|uniref:hypothetical protein n=1 Tax=Caballeronia sp. LjRoot34 TaxID=3342325 RepID=UPI003ED15864
MLKEVLPLNKGISFSGARNRIHTLGKLLDADIERDISKLPHGRSSKLTLPTKNIRLLLICVANEKPRRAPNFLSATYWMPASKLWAS